MSDRRGSGGCELSEELGFRVSFHIFCSFFLFSPVSCAGCCTSGCAPASSLCTAVSVSALLERLLAPVHINNIFSPN